jgi:transposase-like protein
MNLTDPIYSNENAAREHLEALHWPDGPICPHCGTVGNAVKLAGKSTRPGVYKCREPECRKPFSVTVGTVMERSKIPLNTWLAAMALMTASKKGVSAHQLHRQLGLRYESAWFLAHRLRHAMADTKPGPIGGENKFVEADESYVGGKGRNKAFGPTPKKHAVFSLVERGGQARSFHVGRVSAETLRPIIVKVVSRKSDLMTDDSNVYVNVGREFATHQTVDHSWDEYVRKANWYAGRAPYKITTNTVEGYFAILKRGITGIYHHVSEAHLASYLAEFDFRYNNRAALGIDDAERAERLAKGTVGKRLTYRRPDGTAYA